MPNPFPGFDEGSATYEGVTKTVWRKGGGPAVIVMSEMPGNTPRVAEFASKVADRGMTAVMPHLFGTPGREPSIGYALSTIARACISKEFTALATGQASPVTVWLRKLAADEHARCGGPGVGAVGMCFTGGFALAMMVDDTVVAPVLSQPSLPFGLTARHKRDLGLSPADEARVRARAEGGCDVLGLRFTGDKLAPPERFARLRELLGDHFIGVEIDSSKGNPHGHPANAHSVLTEHLDDRPGTPTREALDQVLDFFATRLGVG